MAGIYTQKRALISEHQNQSGQYKGKYKLTPTGSVSSFNVGTRTYTQVTTSFRDRDPKGSLDVDPRQLIIANANRILKPYDTGHEFSTRKGEMILSHPYWQHQSTLGPFWRGALMCSVPGDNITTQARDYSYSPIDLSYGNKAIEATRPTKSAANLSQLLVETLRDVPRLPGLSLAGRPSRRGKERPLNQGGASDFLGSEYLNLVFGWQPTISDVLKICRAIVYKDDIIRQYVRDSGRNVRRRFVFDITESNRSVAVQYLNNTPDGIGPLLNPSWQSYFFQTTADAKGTADLSEKITEKYYFTGAFTYLLEDVLSPSGTMARSAQIARKLLGIDGLTIDLAYQLAPFSWLVDYFANVGDLLSSAEAFNRDSLVLRWGYLMRETRVFRYYRHSGIRFKSGYTGPFTNTEVFKQKLRVKATPYGFGLNTASFTASQWAILVALGMSSGNKTLL